MRKSLYDGKFIGATEEIDQLNADLDQVLVDYRRDYDDETTTEFANSVEVVTGNASDTDLITADEVMDLQTASFQSHFQQTLFTQEMWLMTQR